MPVIKLPVFSARYQDLVFEKLGGASRVRICGTQSQSSQKRVLCLDNRSAPMPWTLGAKVGGWPDPKYARTLEDWHWKWEETTIMLAGLRVGW